MYPPRRPPSVVLTAATFLGQSASFDRMCGGACECMQAGILWVELRCKFERRGPLIAACIALHNWRIDKNLSNNYSDFYSTRATAGGGIEVEVTEGEWVSPPQLDRAGGVVELLSRRPEWISRWQREQETTLVVGPSTQQQRLEEAIAAAGVSRPPASADRAARRR